MCMDNFYLSSAATCTGIPDHGNCKVEVYDSEGHACSECEPGYYRVDNINCALLSSINCATGS